MARVGGSMRSTAKIISYSRCSKGIGRRLSRDYSRMNVEYGKTKLESECSSYRKEEEEDVTDNMNSYWKPDGRTGIYVPKGQESVINQVPEGAASFKHPFWLRNVDDGVDHKQDRSF